MDWRSPDFPRTDGRRERNPCTLKFPALDHIGIGACVLDVGARVEVCVGCVCVRARSSGGGGGHGKFSAVIFFFLVCMFVFSFFLFSWLVFMSRQGTAGLTFPR